MQSQVIDFPYGNDAELSGPILRQLWPLANFAHSGLEIAALNPVYSAKIRTALKARRPLRLVLPAFPAKSPNPQKTLGALPDFAEFLALRNLENLARQIDSIYPWGVEVLICSDGRVFSDLVGVDDEEVSTYARSLEELIARYGFAHLQTYHLDAVFAGTHAEMRAQLFASFAATREELHRSVQQNEAVRRIYNGLHRFLFEDAVGRSGKSRQKVRVETKDQAYELMRRSDAWSRLIEARFPAALRLSIHPQGVEASKFPVQLVPSEDRWRTPWHSVVLVREEDPRGGKLVTRAEAEALGARVRYYDGDLAYFALGPPRICEFV